MRPARVSLLGALLLCALSVLVCACGCGRKTPRQAGPSVRLVELADAARVEARIDFADPADVLRQGTIRVLAEPFDDLEQCRACSGPALARVLGAAQTSGGAARLEGQGPARHALLEGPAALWRVLSMSERVPHRLQARIQASAGADFRFFALNVKQGAALTEFSDMSFARKLKRAQHYEGHEPRPAGKPGEDGFVSYARTFRPKPGCDLLAGVVVARGTVRLDDLELRALRPLCARVLQEEAASASPWVRRVEVAGSHRESLVLAAPGSFRFSLTLPPRARRVALALARLDETDEPSLEMGVAVSGKAGRAAAALPVRSAGADGLPCWSDLELDVARFAGAEVDVELFATAQGEADRELGVAFGAPVIESDGGAEEIDQPDVVLISLDTVRADRLSLYGYAKPTSPILGELARRAVVFEAAIAPASWTLPAHVTIFSGQLPDRHQVTDTNRFIDATTSPLLAADFLAAGYHTAAVTSGGYVSPDFGFAAGFEEYGTVEPIGESLRPEPNAAAAAARSRARIDALLGEPRLRPLFLFVHTYAAHEYRARAEDLAAIGGAAAGVLPLEPPVEVNALRERMKDARGPDEYATDLARMSVAYDAALRLVDGLVLQVLRSLEASGRARNTLVVVLSDHGEELGEHGFFGHGHDVHEELIRVPLLFLVPGVAPRRVAQVVTLADVAPTIRELAGLRSMSALVDGASLVPLLRGESLAPQPAIAYEGREGARRALRGERWKLVVREGADGRSAAQLFDLAGAGGEQADLAASEGALAARLEEALARRVQEMRAAAAAIREHALTPEMKKELEELGYLQGR